MCHLLMDGLFLSLSPHSRVLASFISGLFNFYEDLYFTYLEINPLGNWLFHAWQGQLSQGPQCPKETRHFVSVEELREAPV